MESSPNIAYPTAPVQSSDSLRTRVAAALLGLPILLALIGMDATVEWHGTTLLLLVLFVAGIGAEEFSALLAHRGVTGVPQLGLMVATIPPLLAFVYGRAEIPILLLASSVIIALNTLFIALGVVPDIIHRGGRALRDAVFIIFGTAVIGVGYSFILLLRKPLGTVFAGAAQQPTDLHLAFPAMGWWAVASLFLLVWTTDTLAYFVGRTVGGPKLAARISPSCGTPVTPRWASRALNSSAPMPATKRTSSSSVVPCHSTVASIPMSASRTGSPSRAAATRVRSESDDCAGAAE